MTTDNVLCHGVLRVDTRTKRLIGRLQPGDIAVIKHDDIDRVAAEGLVEARVVAVVNADRSITGRYPNEGPRILAEAGIVLVDNAGPEIMAAAEGSSAEVCADGAVKVDGASVGRGEVLGITEIDDRMLLARRSMGDEIERFAENTLRYIAEERHLVTDQPAVPAVTTKIRGRHALVVVRGSAYREDLSALRSYIRELKPVLIGVDGGADALLEEGLRPDIIIGDMDSVSDAALRCGAELVVHAYRGGVAPGSERLDEMGLRHHRFELAGTSEDIALLLAYEKGADLIVAVGTHASMVEFLDKGRAGMASTFLVRLRVGPILVDAKGVSRLYRSSVSRTDILLLLGGALVLMLSVVAVSDSLRLFLRSLWTLITG